MPVLSQLFCLAERGQAVSPNVQNSRPLNWVTITVSCPIAPECHGASAFDITDCGMSWSAPASTESR